MSTPAETAEAILIVIKRIMKWMFVASLGIGLLVGAIVGYTDYQSSQEYEKKSEQEKKVTIWADYQNGDCAIGYPYFYVVENNSDKEVSKVKFTVQIRKKGFSNPLNSYTSLEEDKILKPKENFVRCFRAQNKDYNGDVKEKDVDIVVTYKEVTFSE